MPGIGPACRDRGRRIQRNIGGHRRCREHRAPAKNCRGSGHKPSSNRRRVKASTPCWWHTPLPRCRRPRRSRTAWYCTPAGLDSVQRQRNGRVVGDECAVVDADACRHVAGADRPGPCFIGLRVADDIDAEVIDRRGRIQRDRAGIDLGCRGGRRSGRSYSRSWRGHYSPSGSQTPALPNRHPVSEMPW